MPHAPAAAVPPLVFKSRLKQSGQIIPPGVFTIALRNSFLKLNPIKMVGNPVVLIAEVGAALVTLLLVHDLWRLGSARLFDLQIALWLWLTVFFANFGEALAQARGKAKADALRKSRSEYLGRRWNGRTLEVVAASKLKVGDIVTVSTGELIPVDGLIVEGIATVDESPITGESAPVIRESGGPLSAVTRGSRVLSDSIKIRVLSTPAETLLERMITEVERSTQQKTRNEVALQSFVATAAIVAFVVITFVFLFAHIDISAGSSRLAPTIASFVTLLVCLVPTSIGALLPVVGTAGLERLVDHNVLAISRKVLESAREVDLVVLDKTGTLTSGLRTAVAFIPFEGVNEQQLAQVAKLASIEDETHEGRSIAALADQYKQPGSQDFDIRAMDLQVVPFSAYTRMSGVDMEGRSIRKGATRAIAAHVKDLGGQPPDLLEAIANEVSRTGGTPLAIAEGSEILGIVHLKDTLKFGTDKHLAELRAMGIRSLLMTGDNPVTAQAIAEEIGVDGIIAQATPADKLAHIKTAQAEGHVIAMVADGPNDAPALAQADIGLAMFDGSTAAKEAGNMLDLDSDPAKIVEVIALSRQIWITRIVLLLFSVITGVVLCLAALPVILAPDHPRFAHLNLLTLRNPESAVLSAAIVNAALILFLCPIALKGVRFRPIPLRMMLISNMVTYLAAAIFIPLPLLWVIDRILGYLHLA